MSVPDRPKIYHIVHVDRLPHILEAGGLYSDARMRKRPSMGTVIGMTDIKQRRLDNPLSSHPDLHVGECVPFYFCPRSVMLYVIAQRNHPELSYKGGQIPIIHLEADLHSVIAWAQSHQKRWAFTTSNAGSRYFDDYSSAEELTAIDWEAVQSDWWQECKEKKQAEFLLEAFFPWTLTERIGVFSHEILQRTRRSLTHAAHRPDVQILPEWYY